MKHSRGLAALALAAAAVTAVTTVTALPSAASAARGAAASTERAAETGAPTGKTVRYAWLRACKKKDYEVPCGHWRLTLRNGKTVKLTDARVHPKLRNGKVEKESSATFAISGDGRYVNYFRASDGKLVVRDVATGKVRALPGRAARLPKGLGMLDVDTMLSTDGRHAIVDYYDDKAKLPTLLIDLSTRAITELPGNENVWSLSPSGDKVLTVRGTSENTSEIVTYDAEGNEIEKRVAPQVVANNGPLAVADDGVTTAFVVQREKGRPLVRRYDLSADQVSPAVTLKLGKYDVPSRISWNTSGSLTLWSTVSNKKGDLVGAVKRTVDPETGALRTEDSFGIRPRLLTWWLPGE
jgi:hypothetical protein